MRPITKNLHTPFFKNTLSPTRRRALCLAPGALAALTLPGLAVPSQALADEAKAAQQQQALSYVGEILAEANAIKKLPDNLRFSRIDELVDQYVNKRYVSRFVLGQYARQISDAQYTTYYPLFEEYARRVYRKVLSDYSGETLAVTNAVVRSGRITDVNSKVTNPSSQYADLLVTWRVYRSDKTGLSIIDAGANGALLAVGMQDTFKSIIANNGGGARGIDALIAQLKDKVG